MLQRGLAARLQDPGAGLQPLRISAIDATNRRFQGLPQRLATNLAQRGYGKSGSLGRGIKGIEFARQGELSNIENEFAKMQLSREDQNYDLGMRLLGLNRGETTTGTGESKTTKSWLENVMALAGMGTAFIPPFGGGKPGQSKTPADGQGGGLTTGGTDDSGQSYIDYQNYLKWINSNPWAGDPYPNDDIPGSKNPQVSGFDQLQWRNGKPYLRLPSGLLTPAKWDEINEKWVPVGGEP